MCKQLVLLLLVLGFCAIPAVNAANITFVTEDDDENGDGVPDDFQWVPWLEAQGYTVDARLEYWTTLDEAKVEELNQADLVIVSRNVDSGSYDDGDEETLWNTVTSPMILMTAYLSRSNRWDWFSHTGLNVYPGSPVLEAVAPGHAIFLGVDLGADNQVQPYDASVPSGGVYMPSGDTGPGIVIAGTLTQDPAIVEWDPGTVFPESNIGAVAVARRMLFCAGTTEGGGNPQGAFNLTPVGQQMFLNAVKYMLGLDLYNASGPVPVNGGDDVPPEAVLTWTAGPSIVSHDVYFGTSLEPVSTATRANPQGVLVSQAQSGASYDPAGLLTLGQTYYWRVDEVEAGGTIHTGDVWSFTAEAIGYPIANVVASASIPSELGSEIENCVNGSGLTPDGGHAIDATTMWQANGVPGAAVSLQFEFDRTYKLYSMQIWNFNHEFEPFLNFSLKDVTVDVSADAAEWTTLGDFVFDKGTGIATLPAQTIELGGVAAKYVRFNVNSNYGGMGYGLSEVVFLYVPVWAREPQPADGAANVDVTSDLSWRAGREAVSHQVHFGTDPNAVADGAALAATVADTTYDPGTLTLGTTYYWKIGEVNDAEAISLWESDLWSFATQEFIVVDDIEGYYDAPGHQIYEAWADGYGNDTNGSVVGHDMPPYVEQSIVLGGRQSMPFSYDNTGSATISEAKLTLPSAQNWTAAGIQTLVVNFRGSLGNAAAQLYVKINNNLVNYPGNPGALAAPVWKQWNVDVAALGNAAQNVTSLTIGVSGPGSGLLYVDDIRLYREAPPMAGPAVDPGTASLVALYAMENNVVDGSGNGRDGTAETGSSFGPGPAGYGQAVVLDGAGGYVSLPIGSLVQSLSSATFATWVNWAGSGSTWCRIFDFGTGTQMNMFLTPNAGGGNLRFAITTTGSGGESQLNRSGTLSGGWHHLAVTIDGAAMAMQMYLDGALVASATTATLPSDLGNTTQNYLGRSQYADPYLPGSIDDFRIYNRALSEAEVRYLVGDR